MIDPMDDERNDLLSDLQRRYPEFTIVASPDHGLVILTGTTAARRRPKWGADEGEP